MLVSFSWLRRLESFSATQRPSFGQRGRETLGVSRLCWRTRRFQKYRACTFTSSKFTSTATPHDAFVLIPNSHACMQANAKYVHSLPPVVALLSSGRLRTWCLLGACSGNSSNGVSDSTISVTSSSSASANSNSSRSSSSSSSSRTVEPIDPSKAGNEVSANQWQSGGGAAYSHVLFQPSLWAKLAPATHVLVMQTDTWLCVGGGVIDGLGFERMYSLNTSTSSSSSSGRSTNGGASNSNGSNRGGGGVYRQLIAFAKRYDFVGAPDSPHHWNGGLSLRHRLTMLEALKRCLNLEKCSCD